MEDLLAKMERLACADVEYGTGGYAEVLDRAREEIERLRGLLQQVPGNLNRAFGAGMEEREGGSARRQAKMMEPVYRLENEVRAALEGKDNAL